MGEVEVMETDTTGTAEAPAELPVDPERLLIEELSRIRDDRSLISQIARLVQLSRELRSRRYTGQVTLHLGNGLINLACQMEWVDWRRRKLCLP